VIYSNELCITRITETKIYVWSGFLWNISSERIPLLAIWPRMVIHGRIIQLPYRTYSVNIGVSSGHKRKSNRESICIQHQICICGNQRNSNCKVAKHDPSALNSATGKIRRWPHALAICLMISSITSMKTKPWDTKIVFTYIFTIGWYKYENSSFNAIESPSISHNGYCRSKGSFPINDTDHRILFSLNSERLYFG